MTPAIRRLEEEAARLTGKRDELAAQCVSYAATISDCQAKIASLDNRIAAFNAAIAKLKA